MGKELDLKVGIRVANRRACRRAREERGQATVEFAIVVPLVLLLILGIIEFSKAFNYWINLNHLSNEGARWAAVNYIPGTPAPQRIQLKQYLLAQMNTGDLQDFVSGRKADVNGKADPFLCNIQVKVAGTGPGGSAQIGDPVTVAIRAPGYSLASLGESFLGNYGKITLGGSSTMRLEQVPLWANQPSDPNCP